MVNNRLILDGIPLPAVSVRKCIYFGTEQWILNWIVASGRGPWQIWNSIVCNTDLVCNRLITARLSSHRQKWDNDQKLEKLPVSFLRRWRTVISNVRCVGSSRCIPSRGLGCAYPGMQQKRTNKTGVLSAMRDIWKKLLLLAKKTAKSGDKSGAVPYHKDGSNSNDRQYYSYSVSWYKTAISIRSRYGCGGWSTTPNLNAMIDLSKVQNYYVACGYTNLRRGIDGLAVIVSQQYGRHLDEESMVLFCGRRTDRIKALYWSGDGYILLYKRLSNGWFQWPSSEAELGLIDHQSFR